VRQASETFGPLAYVIEFSVKSADRQETNR
jgi:hypothetical protein